MFLKPFAWIVAGLACFRTVAALGAAALLAAGCGMLPPLGDRVPEAALAPQEDSALVRIARDSSPSPELTGFRLMPIGSYALDARVQLARRARHSIDAQYYQLNNDDTGRLLLRNLRDAAARGVRVRLLVDDLYTVGADDLLRSFAAFPNVEVRLFNPFCCGRTSIAAKYATSLADFGRLNHRMHNKLYIADGAIVVAGGRNIADEYFMRSMTDNFVDMDALMTGAVVPQLTRIFDTYWNSPYVYPIDAILPARADDATLQATFRHLVDEGEQMMSLALPPVDILGYGPIAEDLDAGRLGLVWGTARAFADAPDKVKAMTDDEARSMSVSMGVLDLIWKAREEVVISSPYFIPGERSVEQFVALVKQGVKVTILTNSLASNDEPVVHTGYARYRPALVRAGIDLYELSPSRIHRAKRLMFPGMSLGRLHAKTAVIDRSTVFIGSMNLDPRSASKNTELGIIAQCPELAKEVTRVIHISKLQSAYRLRLTKDGQSLEWLAMDDDAEVVLDVEPDTS